MSHIYEKYPLWLTMDVEQLQDANFGVSMHSSPKIDYEDIIDRWIEKCEQWQIKSTCFVLGSFAKKFPKSIEKLSLNGHEVASHGLKHNLVYEDTFDSFKNSISESKKILENTTQKQINGYRSASWSLPFEKKYYEALVQEGYSYSSSYFPFKTYMYGNSIDRKEPFEITTDSGTIREIPLLKSLLPFSGGFYLRVLPLVLHKILMKSLLNKAHKPIIYTHPYEMQGRYMPLSMREDIKINIAYILAFAETSVTQNKLEKLLQYGLKA